MAVAELFKEMLLGEDSRQRAARDIRNLDSLAAELVASAKSGGGGLLFGVNDGGKICGLTRAGTETFQKLSQQPEFGLQETFNAALRLKIPFR